MNMNLASFFLFVSILLKTFHIVLTESRNRTSMSQASVSLQPILSNSKLWFWFYNISSIPSFSFGNCRGGGVLDNQPRPVPEHQHHVHSLSESSHSSRSGSQHQVRWCGTWCWHALWPTGIVEARCCWFGCVSDFTVPGWPMAVHHWLLWETLLDQSSSNTWRDTAALVARWDQQPLSSFRTNRQQCHSSKILILNLVWQIVLCSSCFTKKKVKKYFFKSD